MIDGMPGRDIDIASVIKRTRIISFPSAPYVRAVSRQTARTLAKFRQQVTVFDFQTGRNFKGRRTRDARDVSDAMGARLIYARLLARMRMRVHVRVRVR